MTARMTGILCLLASLPAIGGGGRLDELAKTMTQLRQVAEKVETINPTTGEPGGVSDSQSTQPGGLGAGLMALLTGGDTTINVPKKAPPPQHSTLIRYIPGDQPGETGRCQTEKVPAGTNVMVIDGRVQVFRPRDNAGK
jgi:hypothetical protein